MEEDGQLLFNAAKEHGLEGIMAKRKDSKYVPGKRSDHWCKIKVRPSRECVLLGFTPGKGEREKLFGALQIAELIEGELMYRGKVGTGFDEDTMKEILSEIKQYKVIKKPSLKGGKVVDEKITTWIEPKAIAEIDFARLTPDEMFREPVFVRLRPDLS